MKTHPDTYMRQTGLIDPIKLDKEIHIVGVGGTGSWATLFLAKMGCSKLTVIDFDTVEVHNMAYQFYANNDIGRYKTSALLKHILDFTPNRIDVAVSTYQNFLRGSKRKPDIIIMAVDKMRTRHEIAAIIKKWKKKVHVIDPRMGGDQLEIYVATNKNYGKTLVPVDDVQSVPCSARSVVYNMSVVGGLVCNKVKKLINKQRVKSRLVYDLRNSMLITE